MTKKEIVWREILHQAQQHGERRFTQQALARKFSLSLSTVFNALKVPRASGAIEVRGRGFRLRDFEKFLLLWATYRNVRKDIAYQTHTDLSVRAAEGALPAGVILGAYSAYRFTYHDAPADYDKVYVYADEIDVIKKRFPPTKGYANIFVLKPDPFLHTYGHTTPPVQTFVDLWNLEDWYAKDFLNALKGRLAT